MIVNIKYWISGLLILSSGLLGILVPGGSIETRDFSQIEPIILGTFNTFLTVLAIGSLLVVYFIFLEAKWAFMVAAICGFSYFMVYFVLRLTLNISINSDIL